MPRARFSRASARMAQDAVPHSSATTSVLPRQQTMAEVRPASNTTLRCCEIDAHGRVTLGSVVRSAICRSLGVQPRDLRRLDGTLCEQLPAILVRARAILLQIESVRIIVKNDGMLLLLDSSAPPEAHKPLIRGLQRRIRAFRDTQEPASNGDAQPQSAFNQNRHDHGAASIGACDEASDALYGHMGSDASLASDSSSSASAFEFVVLETALAHTMGRLTSEFAALSVEIEEHLSAIEGILHWERLRVLLVGRKRLTLFNERIEGVRECLKSVLDSDADMAAMYLSEAAAAGSGRCRPTDAHEEIELMLESYLRTAEELASRCQVLMSHMSSTEDIVNIGLVGQRNALLMLDLRLGIGTFAASMGGFGASMLGMNLANGFEHAPYAFWLVLTGLCSVAGLSFAATWQRLARLVKMY